MKIIIKEQQKKYKTLCLNINWMRNKINELELIENNANIKKLTNCRHQLKLYENLLEENYKPIKRRIKWKKQ